MLCNEERMDEKNLRIGDKMIHTRGKAEGLREKLATILSQDYKELADSGFKGDWNGSAKYCFSRRFRKGSFSISSAMGKRSRKYK